MDLRDHFVMGMYPGNQATWTQPARLEEALGINLPVGWLGLGETYTPRNDPREDSRYILIRINPVN